MSNVMSWKRFSRSSGSRIMEQVSETVTSVPHQHFKHLKKKHLPFLIFHGSIILQYQRSGWVNTNQSSIESALISDQSQAKSVSRSKQQSYGRNGCNPGLKSRKKGYTLVSARRSKIGLSYFKRSYHNGKTTRALLSPTVCWVDQGSTREIQTTARLTTAKTCQTICE